ncbi:hypothetical protein Heshes_00160 [Alicyclobacillus hesperidum]|uniref:Uncharacterized protein n=1 Tax=Alicyclobacillus hesperidum TaxID=89784 RepID=A0A1H2SE15_9BACL|nr:hypothetical protein [Alicyclobacillus hesperidum]GLV12332.1 hypothetical protein Heshes_00160 [Alicyclobacillus hesperidum]SDW29767.1 hypothetical protein SAMN04489725_10420 [Alicyclobacillus hesperidum]
MVVKPELPQYVRDMEIQLALKHLGRKEGRVRNVQSGDTEKQTLR